MRRPCDGGDWEQAKYTMRMAGEEKSIERIGQTGHKDLDQVHACSDGPVSDFVPEAMGEYREIYTREWQELAFFYSLGHDISAEQR